MTEVKPVGTEQEVKTFQECMGHYTIAVEDLEQRIKTTFDKADELFRSHIDDSNWPYNALIFDPRIFTSIYEKSSRLFANKPRGRMVPREGGDSLGARINNELLNFQWDDNERVDNQPMLAKWALMDQNTRKYGAGFALVKWQYEKSITRDKKDETKGKAKCFYDGPNFKPLINRDCLPNPAYSTIKNWFQHRDYVTIQELENVNDAARGKPVYKNLDILRDKLRKDKDGGDSREANYLSKNKSIKNLTDYIGRDEVFKTLEVVTEYRNERWITFAPKHGVVIRDIPNPYDHGQIPVTMLKYYPVDDDLYGLSEIEPVEKLQRAINALWSQYTDAINMSLYSPLKVRSTGVQMHTLEFGPGKKWLMNDPSSDVIAHDQSPTGVTEFATTYRLAIGALQEGLGETSEGVSNASPGQSDKTATEVRDSSRQRLARDNFNQIFLSEAMKKQMMFWSKMNQQFFFTQGEKVKVIRIVGKDAIRYFEQIGLGDLTVSDEVIQMLASDDFAGMNLDPNEFATENYPVDLEGEQMPKFALDETGDVGSLLVEPDDLSGTYDYIPDIESMALPDEAQLLAVKNQMIEQAKDPVIQQQLAMEGYKLKMKELLEDFYEQAGMKDADKYFEKLPSSPGGVDANGNPIAGGGIGAQAGQPGLGASPVGGMAGNIPANVGVQNQAPMGRPA
jgi:hypothetical protein